MDKAQEAEARVMLWMLQLYCVSGVIGSCYLAAHFSPLSYIKYFHNWYIFIICHQFKQNKNFTSLFSVKKFYITSRLQASAADVCVGKYEVHLHSCSVPIFYFFSLRKISARRTSSTSALSSVMIIPYSTKNTSQAFPN